MNNKKFCDVFDCNYDSYYLSQAGGAYEKDQLSFYTGKPFMRGFNIFTRIGIPVLKYLGKNFFKYGKNVTKDVLSGETPKIALKSNLKRSASDVLDDIKEKINQKGKRLRVNWHKKPSSIKASKKGKKSQTKKKRQTIKKYKSKSKPKKKKNVFDKK